MRNFVSDRAREIPPSGIRKFFDLVMGIGLVLYSTWYYTKIEALNILAFIVLIVGALFVWYRQT